MRKFLSVLCVALATAFVSFPVSAQEQGNHQEEHGHDDHDDHYDDHHPERIDHYAGQSFSSASAAAQALRKNVGKIKEILSADEITDQDLEFVHEISYSLESAIDKLKDAQAGAPATLDAIDEAVQALHYASENHEQAKTQEWLGKLAAAIDAMGHDSEAIKAHKKGEYEIIIKDHMFSPETLYVPAGQKIKLIVDNQDPTPEEFESHDMNREKIISGNSKATIFVGPLKPGKYHYFGEFNMDSANGYIVAE